MKTRTLENPISTLSMMRERRGPALKSGEGMKCQKTITINRPVADVYSFWRNTENLARFMTHVRRITLRNEHISHWVVSPDEKNLFEWDAEIIEDRVNEIISWQSMPGGDVDSAGTVRFNAAPGNRGTVLKVTMKYSPPGGKLAAMILKFTGRDAGAVIEEDLFRLKSLMESGEIPSIEGQPRGGQNPQGAI